MTTLLVPPRASTLTELLDARSDPMLAVKKSPWLKDFRKVPADAAVPLAMSGPHPRAVGSYGADCLAWAKREMGLTPRWWQALAITRQLEHDADGVPVYREIVESGPRRIGKSVRLRICACWRCAHAELIGETQLSMLVSKDLAVGKEIHRGSWRWAEKRGWKVIRLGGAQEIEGPDESRWLLRADTACYGYDVGYGQVDESWGVDPTSITDGLEPALLERMWSQLHLTSTAHVKATSLMRRRLVAALKDADPDILLMLWGARPDADFSLESTWKAASPHWTQARGDLVRRKYRAALAGEADPEIDDPDPVRGWAAQYLNVWPMLEQTAGGGVLPGWGGCELLGQALPDLTAIGLGVSLDGDFGSIAAARRWADGERVNLGAVERRPGTTWLVDEAKRIQTKYRCAVALDEKCPDATLHGRLVRAGVSVQVMTLDDLVETCSDLVNRSRERTITHQSTTDLDGAIGSAKWRTVGDGRKVFGRRASTGDIDMLEAGTAALWAAGQTVEAWEAYT